MEQAAKLEIHPMRAQSETQEMKSPISVHYPPSASSAGLDTDKCEVTNDYFEYFWRWRVHVSSIFTSRLQRRIIILLHLSIRCIITAKGVWCILPFNINQVLR